MELIPKPIYGQCKCCLKNTYLRNMWEAHKNNGDLEVYGQMLVDCFSINWTIVTMEDDNMCQVCISKLRVANDFKKQVLESQAATLEAAQVEEQPEDNVVLETVVVQNNEDVSTEEVTIPLKKDLITVPIKKVSCITSITEEYITPSKDHATEESSDEETHENSLEKVSKGLNFVKSESDLTEADVRKFEDVEFLEEDCLEVYDDDDDEDIEPNKKKRKRTRNLQIRNQRRMYRNYLEEDMQKAVEAVKSGQMSKREAAQVFDVPRESIAVRSTVEKYEGEQTDLGIPAQLAQHNGNKEFIQEAIENQDQNGATHLKIQNPQLENGDNTNIAVSKNVVSEILPLDNRKDVLDRKPILETDSKENRPEIQESDTENNSIAEEVQDKMYTKIPKSDTQHGNTLEIQKIDPQNGTAASADMPNYVLMQIEGSDQDISVIHNNVSAADILEMHKTNITSILAASNATPIRGHWGSGFACYYCSQNFADPSDLKKHTYTHDNLLAIKVKSVSDHVIKLDVTALKCNICDIGMNSLEDLMEHLKNGHGLAMYLDIPNHILPFDFTSNELKCVECFDQFQTFKDLSDHMGNAHYRNNVCIQCNQGFVNVRSLKTHSIKHGISMLLCSYCPDYFYYKEDVAEHENATHPTETFNKAQENQTQSVSVAMEKLKNLKQNFATKYDNIEDERKFEYKNQIALNIVNEVKNKIKLEMPKKCNKEWNISVNETNLNYQCKVCLKMFKSSAALSFHSNLSHQHKCHFCNGVFDIKFDLQRHMRKVHPSKLYECSKCSKKFTSQKNLEVHIAKHEYCCELCCTKFADEGSYMTHMKNEHGLE